MSSFWPEGIEIPARSPLQILEEAREQWEKESADLLSLYFDSNNNGILDCYVTPKTEGNAIVMKSIYLFQVETSKGQFYPATIFRSGYEKIYCQTQGEFRKALETAMNWGETKSAALNVAIAIDAQNK
jgi:hypothetical protein